MWFICSENIAKLLASLQSSTNCDLIGSWGVEVGDTDQFLHLWRFKGGFAGVDKGRQLVASNSVS